MSVKVKWKIPRMPNFIMLPALGPDAKIAVGALSKDEAEAIGEEWKQAFIAWCEAKRKDLEGR